MSLITSYLLPTDELTVTDQKNLRERAVKAGVRRALDLKIATTEDGLRVRHAQNVADFGSATELWNTSALVAVNTAYSVFPAAATPTLANNRLAVFYKAGVETAPSPVSLLSFREGAAAGSTYANFDLEQFVTKLQAEGYFSEPVVYDPQRVMNIVVTCRIATAVFARLILGCFIIEPGGPVLS